jgi:RNA polymerase sigma-70 factor (ECF subfamily)
MESSMAVKKDGETERLVARAKGGEKRAFAELALRFRVFLERFISSRIGPHLKGKMETDDAIQETLLRAFQSVSRFEWRGEASFERWLKMIAEHVILEGVRRENRQRISLETDLPGRAPSPSKAARREERFDRFEHALKGLSPDHRKVIILARMEGLKIKEIARSMNRSPDAIKKLLSRALRELKKGFGDTESFHLPDRRLHANGPMNPEE